MQQAVIRLNAGRAVAGFLLAVLGVLLLLQAQRVLRDTLNPYWSLIFAAMELGAGGGPNPQPPTPAQICSTR